MSLLDLPPEILSEIWSHLVVAETVIEPYTAHWSWAEKDLSTGVLLTSKKVYTEAIYLLYHKNTFLFRFGEHPEWFFDTIGDANLATLRDLRIIPYPRLMWMKYQRTELSKYDIHQEEVWDYNSHDYHRL